MTDEIERRVWEYIAKVDELGGAVQAIEKQFYQSQIAESAYKYQLAIERKEKVIVGVNDFRVEREQTPDTLRIDEEMRMKQIRILQATKAARDRVKVEESLNRIQKSAEGRENIVPSILAAVEAYATVGEISDALRKVWGDYEK
jgi:methylmalonyl-CoA mutase N-terminal domain/subunit